MLEVREKPWWWPRSPEEIVPYPWLHPQVIERLESLLHPEMVVLEHGSGGSTLWFAERVNSVLTIEHNHEWREKVRHLALENVVVIAKQLTDLHLERNWDLFFIDGDHDERGACLEIAPHIVRPGGWVVLDNANRPEYALERAKFGQKAVMTARFDNNISISKYFVTEFWQLCE